MLLFKAQNPLARSIAVVSRWCGPIVTLVVIARLTNFEAEDYHRPAPKLVGSVRRRQLRHCFLPFVTHFTALYRPHTPYACILLRAHAPRMLIGASIAIVPPIHVLALPALPP